MKAKSINRLQKIGINLNLIFLPEQRITILP